MANILFASNNIIDFIGSTASSNAATFDSNRVPYSIFIGDGLWSRSPEFEPTTTDDTWTHFTLYADYILVSEGTIFKLYDANNDVILKLEMIKISNVWNVQVTLYRDGVPSVLNDVFTMLNRIKHTFDIQHTVTALSSSVNVYWNRILILSGSTGAPDASPLPAKTIELASKTNSVMFSELLISDGDTRNARMNLLTFSAVGFYSDWDGTVSTLADGDSATGMTTKLIDQSVSLTLSAYTGSLNISNIVIMSTAINGSGSPDNLQHFIRGSGIDHMGTIFPISGIVTSQISNSTINPTTSLPWVASDLATVEIGFKSLT